MIFWFIIIIALIPPLASLFPSGYFASHDGSFHLVRLIHFYSALSSGQFPVRIAPELAYGYSYPLFNFFYPFPYYFGSFFHFLGFSFGSSLKLVMATSLISSVIFFYLFIKSHFPRFPSLVATLIFLYAPYRFLSFYVNGALGIIVALGLVPVILYFLSQKKYLLFSLFYSLLLTSHNVSAMFFTPIFIIYVLATTRPLKPFFFSLILSFGLAAYFLLPVFHDLPYTRLGTQIAVNFRDHFPSLKQLIYSPWGYGYSRSDLLDGESFQIGFAQIFIFLTSSIFIFKKIIKKQKIKPLPIIFLLISLITFFLMLPNSVFLWEKIHILWQIQYPWRLLSLLILTSAYLSAWLLSQIKNRRIQFVLGLFLIFLAFYNNRNYLRPHSPQRFPDINYFQDTPLFNGSTDIAWETRPVWANFSPVWFPQSPVFSPINLNYQVIKDTSSKLNLIFDSPQPAPISLNLYYYPNWQVYLISQDNSLEKIPTSPDTTGRLEFQLPSGKNQVMVRYESTPIQKFANCLTLLSYICLFLLLKKNHHSSFFSTSKPK